MIDEKVAMNCKSLANKKWYYTASCMGIVKERPKQRKKILYI